MNGKESWSAPPLVPVSLFEVLGAADSQTHLSVGVLAMLLRRKEQKFAEFVARAFVYTYYTSCFCAPPENLLASWLASLGGAWGERAREPPLGLRWASAGPPESLERGCRERERGPESSTLV